MKIIKTNELHLLAGNRSGALATVLGLVGKAKVNILAYCGYSMSGKGHIHLVTENNARVTAALKKAGYKVSRNPVVVVKAGDTVGQGARLAQKIAKAGINLSAAYATAAGGQYITVYEAGNQSKLARALK